MEFTREQQITEAALLNTVVRSVQDDTYRKQKEVMRLFNASIYQPDGAGPLQYYRRLVPYACGYTDYEQLLPILAAYEDALGESMIANTEDSLYEERRILSGILQLRALEGGLDGFSRSHPEAEAWIRRTSASILEMLRSTERSAWKEGKWIAQAVLGTAVQAHNLFAGLTPLLQKHANTHLKEFSLLGRCVSDIRRALMHTLVRDIIDEYERTDGVPSGFSDEIDCFLERRFHPTAFPNVMGMETRNFYHLLQDFRGDLAEILEGIGAARCLYGDGAQIAHALSDIPHASSDTQRALPWGQVLLVQGDDEHMVYYTADDIMRRSSIGLSMAEGEGKEVPLVDFTLPQDFYATLNDLWMCHMDDRCKLYFSSIDRLAPEPTSDSYQHAKEGMRKFDAMLNTHLKREWETGLEYFQRLDHLGPYIIVRLPDAQALCCRASVTESVRAIFGRDAEDAERTQSLLQRIRFTADEPWVSFPLDPLPAEQEDAEELPSDPTILPAHDRRWRVLLRRRLGERIELSEIERILRLFGEVTVVTGRGSHRTLRFMRGGQQHPYTIPQSFRGTEPLYILTFFKMLEQCGIGYDELYVRLSNGKNGNGRNENGKNGKKNGHHTP